MGLCAAKAAWNWLSKWGYIIGMTVAKTAYDVVQGVVTSPYAVFCQCCDWFQDPLNPNKIPILGPLGQAIGEGWAAAYETGSFEDYSKAVGNTAFGVATALGGAAAYRGAMGGGAAPKRIGYHATDPEVVPIIEKEGFKNGTAPGRLGANGVYVNNTPEGAIAEFAHYNPGKNPAVLQVDYSPGVEAVTDVAPSKYIQDIPLNVDSVSAPSVRAPSTTNTNVLNNSVKPIKRIK